MYFLLKMVIFHCYVSLPEGRPSVWMSTFFKPQTVWLNVGLKFQTLVVGFFGTMGVEPKIGGFYPQKWMVYNGKPY